MTTAANRASEMTMTIAELLVAARRCASMLAKRDSPGRPKAVLASALLIERLRNEYRRAAGEFDGHIELLRGLSDHVAQAVREEESVACCIEDWARGGNDCELLKTYLRRTHPELAVNVRLWESAPVLGSRHVGYDSWDGTKAFDEDGEELEDGLDYSMDYEAEEDEVQEPTASFGVDPDFREAWGFGNGVQDDGDTTLS